MRVCSRYKARGLHTKGLISSILAETNSVIPAVYHPPAETMNLNQILQAMGKTVQEELADPVGIKSLARSWSARSFVPLEELV